MAWKWPSDGVEKSAEPGGAGGRFLLMLIAADVWGSQRRSVLRDLPGLLLFCLLPVKIQVQ